MKKVQNMINTSNDWCSCCDSWLDHWEKYTKEPAVFYSVVGCEETNNLEGAHVKEISSSTPKIIPLCSKHNKLESNFAVSDDTFFAPVEKYRQ